MKPEKNTDREQELLKKQDKTKKILFWCIVLVVHTLLLLFGASLGPIIKVYGSVHLMWWHVVAGVLIFYNRSNFQKQNPDEIGAKLFYGLWLYQTSPGPVYVPRGFCTFIKESVLIQQWEIPSDLPERYKDIKTLRITTAASNKKDSADPLETGRLTLEGVFLVEARLDREPGGFRQFVERVGSVGNFLKIADDEVVNRISKEVMIRTPSQVFSEWQQLEDQATEKLRARIEHFGFAELSVKAKGFDLPKRVNEALADRTAAQTAVETERLKGEQTKQRQLGEAQGLKALRSAELQGVLQALEFAMKRKEDGGLGLTNEQAVFMAYQGTLATALKEANYTLLPQGTGGFMDPATMMAIMRESMDSIKRPKEDGKDGSSTV